MTRLHAWLLSLLIGELYVVTGYGQVFGVSARLQGAEVIRADAARGLSTGIGSSVFGERYEAIYGRIRIELHRVRDV